MRTSPAGHVYRLDPEAVGVALGAIARGRYALDLTDASPAADRLEDPEDEDEALDDSDHVDRIDDRDGEDDCECLRPAIPGTPRRDPFRRPEE